MRPVREEWIHQDLHEISTSPQIKATTLLVTYNKYTHVLFTWFKQSRQVFKMFHTCTTVSDTKAHYWKCYNVKEMYVQHFKALE